MTGQGALDRLSLLMGIEPEYTDIWGKSHIVTDKVKRALIEAMGVSCGDDDSIKAALEERENRPWRRLTPSALVVRESGFPFRLSLSLPEAMMGSEIRWELFTERGERLAGAVNPKELSVSSRRVVDGEAFLKLAFFLPENPGLGYHRLQVSCADRFSSMSLIVAPDTCYVPSALYGEGRVWGPSVQLYSLRSGRNWGMGDFTDLKTLVDHCAEIGADVAGLNPLHALFPHNPDHCGPYSPSSRLFLNIMYVDVEAAAEYAECAEARDMAQSPDFQRRAQEARQSDLVCYREVAALKMPVLEALYREFRARHVGRNTDRERAFRAFQAEGGEDLYRHTLFEALQERFHGEDKRVWGWQVWPEEYKNPMAPAVGRFAGENRERIEFYQYIQWQARIQLESAGLRALERGLGVGLYLDLAVSVDKAGAEAWAHQDVYALRAGIGAPPDDFNLKGQNWGLVPMIPEKLTESAYAPFISILRRNMRDAGALRIDHVMGLMRLFWIPNGGSPAQAAYVRYPFEDLLGVLALESHRNRCLVVGEDLGTVPDEVRRRLAPMKVFSYRLLYFEKDKDGEYKKPADYPARSAAAVSTHDLPTLSGFWEGRDLVLREELDLFPSDESREEQTIERARDRARLLVALKREGLLPQNVDLDPASAPRMTGELARSVYKYLARSPSKLMMLQLEDVFGQTEQVNMPGSTYQHPNWRRKLSVSLEEARRDGRLLSMAPELVSERREAGAEKRAPGEAARPGPGEVIPRATYRLQFNAGFTFSAAADIVPYLDDLGISHVYASPYLKARPGSAHGYDIVDHRKLNPEIGSPEDYAKFVESMRQRGVGQIVDVVPNHMGVMGSDNEWWLDVLENGPASMYAGFFDIDWEPVKRELRGKALVPVLANHYGIILENGELSLVFDAPSGAFSVCYHDSRFPVDPGEYPMALKRRIEALEMRLGPGNQSLVELRSLITAFEHLPPRTEKKREKLEERRRDKEVHKKWLARLCAESAEIKSHIENTVAEFNGRKGDPSSHRLLHRLLEAQAYRLAHWRVAGDEINYRRFFDINDLAGLRVENEQVFEASHQFIFELVRDGSAQGLRIDHLDGLYDPLEYCRRLVDRINALPGGADARGVYLLAEKILAGYEQLPEDWPVHGTTGYDFANLVNGLYVDASSENRMTRVYERFMGRKADFGELLYGGKKKIMRVSLASELNVLANRLNRLSESDRQTRDYTLNGLRDALAEVVAFFPVYRTYVTSRQVTDQDRYYVNWAVEQAKKRSSAADTTIYDFIRDVLLSRAGEGKSEAYRGACADFAMRFQQYTSPVMAKGMEDTAFYSYNRLVSLNEVGGDPRRFGVSAGAFHRVNQERARRFPHSMLCTSTHDTKRSEDTRARINALSEFPDEWRKRVSRWNRLGRSKKRKMEGGLAPSKNDEYLLYQTLIGAWPEGEPDAAEMEAFRERVKNYMLKAAREAKDRTSWTKPNEEYESALTGFVDSLLARGRKNPFLDDFVPFQRMISRVGMFNSLSQLALKMTAPGVPDIYQGTELWDFSLADPDNRRPVDYERRRMALGEIKRIADAPARELAGRVRALLENMESGAVKLYLMWRALGLRRRLPELFGSGEYAPLAVEGERADNLVAFMRKYKKRSVIVMAPRLLGALTDGGVREPMGGVWLGTRVIVQSGRAAGKYVNELTGEAAEASHAGNGLSIAVSEVLKNFPVAILASADGE